MSMDNESFWKLLEPLHDEAAAFCQKLAGDRDAGEDLYQDALLKGMRRFGHLREASAFRPWLYRVIVNSFRNRLRRSVRRGGATAKDLEAENLSGHDPRDEYESRRRLEALLSKLSREDKAMVVLHDIDGWSIPELARMLGRPEGTIKTRLFRARRKMRRIIERSLSSALSTRTKVEGEYALRTGKAVDK
ncbi:MAG: RNA polymerase sigma factor [Candidatus Zixiibacteriota bacterium]|nr:MAG: RNA polymerase sigma factor [candidate division Zixibacteria bacterium]